jgi:restriction system protein
MIPFAYPLSDITPSEYERHVARQLEHLGYGLPELKVRHRQVIAGGRSTKYEFDVTARFTALGADFLVLVECKHWKNPVGRSVVELLHDRMLNVGAQKGMIFTTSDFQSGAIEFASEKRIACVVLADGRSAWRTRGQGEQVEPPPELGIPPIIGWLVKKVEGKTEFSVVSEREPDYLRAWLFDEPS